MYWLPVCFFARLNIMFESKNYSIQSLRAIAAILVVIDHTITQFNLYNNYTGVFGAVLKNIESFGIVGVYVFFIISGYIMAMTTYNYDGGVSDAYVFIKKRLFRIFPAYWIWLTILTIMWIAGVALRSHDYSLTKIVSSYLLLPYFDGVKSGINPILSQGWTLIYEMFYYYIFAFFILLKVKSKLMVLLIALSFLAITVLAKSASFSSESLNILFSSGVVFFFPLGMFIFQYQKNITKLFFPTTSKVITYIILAGVMLYVIFRKDNEFYTESNVVCATLIFFIFFASNIKTYLLSIIGDASYSIYLSHTFIVMAYGIISKSSRFSPNLLLIMSVFVFLASIAFGIASYYLIENRIHNMTKRYTGGRSKVTA
ncbi:acyltransferase family protein [Serratia fonticola]|uniref:acyltransferase family protein n=1 Tax=Serratia fonticola TaxID=47917 RepID=UPI00137676DA|nr:acyltransferase [Serratia fonticola]NBJ33769.1 acyltransferase family protein [Serratia fonticola]